MDSGRSVLCGEVRVQGEMEEGKGGINGNGKKYNYKKKELPLQIHREKA